MKGYVHFGTITLVLLATIGLVNAQPSGDAARPLSKNQQQSQERKLTLSPAQKTAIFTVIRSSNVNIKPPPSSLRVAMGAQVPSDTELYALPDAAIKDVPDLKQYKFTIVADTLLVIDPVSMQIVEIIR